MLSLTRHIVVGDSVNHQLGIEVHDSPGAGGAYHLYKITGFDHDTNVSKSDHFPGPNSCEILFQNGPIKEFGVNGVTQEALLAIVIHRLQCFQDGPFKSEYNATALQCCMIGLDALKQRTIDRLARGVEGSHAK